MRRSLDSIRRRDAAVYVRCVISFHFWCRGCSSIQCLLSAADHLPSKHLFRPVAVALLLHTFAYCTVSQSECAAGRHSTCCLYDGMCILQITKIFNPFHFRGSILSVFVLNRFGAVLGFEWFVSVSPQTLYIFHHSTSHCFVHLESETGYGLLGTGNTADVYDASLATTVDLGTGFEARELSCGYWHCCAVSDVCHVTIVVVCTDSDCSCVLFTHY